MKKKRKRITAFILSMVLCIAMMTSTAFADNVTAAAGSTVTETVQESGQSGTVGTSDAEEAAEEKVSLDTADDEISTDGDTSDESDGIAGTGSESGSAEKLSFDVVEEDEEDPAKEDEFGIALVDDVTANTAEAFKAAVEAAAEGDNVTLTGDINVDWSSGDYITVSKDNVTVDLGGYTITVSGAASGKSLFNVTTTGTFTLKNGTILGKDITDENSSDAKCYALSATTSAATDREIDLNGVTIEYFAPTYAAVYATNGGSVSVTSCNISNNNAGGVYCKGGASSTQYNMSLTVDNSKICNNESENAGGIFLMYGDDLTVENGSEISGNVSSGGYGGGGIYGDNLYGTVTIIDSDISENWAAGNGGGIYLYRAYDQLNVYIIGNTISDNIAAADGRYAGSGGGICLYQAQSYNFGFGAVQIMDNTISGNTAEATTSGSGDIALGGGVCIYDAGLSGSNDDYDLSGNTVSGNKADRGGGLVLQGRITDKKFIIRSGYITGNTAVDGGGIAGSVKNFV